MAAPSISVVRTPAGVVNPGTPLTFTVTAADADARTLSYKFTAADIGGTTKDVIESVVVSDPVTVTASVSDPAGTASTPVKDTVNPSIWRSTV